MEFVTISSCIEAIYRKPYDNGIILNDNSTYITNTTIKSIELSGDIKTKIVNNSVDLYIDIKSDNKLNNIKYKTFNDKLSYINSLYLKEIVSKDLVVFIEKNLIQQFSNNAELIISIPNFGPPLLTYEQEASSSDTTINEFIVPVRLGEYHNIFEVSPTTGEKIDKVLNRPYGIHYDDTKIYGRLITNVPVTLTVIFNSGRRIKITLKPYISERVQSLIDNA